MKLDVLKLLDLEYLNNLVLEIDTQVVRLKNSFLEQYDFNKLRELSIDDIKKLFDGYSVSCENIVKYFESDFIDENWEFADLFFDDISNSSKIKDELIKGAENELQELNNKITTLNDSFEKEIKELADTLDVVNLFIKCLNSDSVLSKEDFKELYEYINISGFSDEERFILSYDIVKFLLDSNRSVSLKESYDEMAEFEQMLGDAYSSSKNNDDTVYEDIVEPTYSETIVSCYDYYKKLFDEIFSTDISLGQIMEECYTTSIAVNPSDVSLDKCSFCIQVGTLLYLLNENQGREVANQDVIADVLSDLSILEKFYEEDLQMSTYKKEMLDSVMNDMDIVTRVNIASSFKDKIYNRLNLLYIELKDNLISFKRREEINEEYKKIKEDFVRLAKTIEETKKVKELLKKVEKLLKNAYSSTSFVNSDYCDELLKLELYLKNLKSKVDLNGEGKEIEDGILEAIEMFNKISKFSKVKENTSLKGFVLFDFNAEGKPYVLSDLDLNNKHNLIDSSCDVNKLSSSFEDYSILINDLLVSGQPRVLQGEIPSNINKILDKIYYDEERKRPTKMTKIVPRTNSLVRFISQKVLLHSDTEIFKQVTSIIKEVIPNITINMNEDFVLYINFSSSIERVGNHIYDRVCINRYDRKSALYNLILKDLHNDSLTEEECSLFRDIVNMSLNAYNELEKKNEHFKFDVIMQNGGMKTRG